VSADVLVAGIGNLFFGDDGFGVEVVRKLAGEPLPPGVEVADYGIRGVHLAYRLLDAPRLLVLVDAVSRGGAPGTLYVIDPEVEPASPTALGDGHTIDVASVLGAARALGGSLPVVRVVGCEPEALDPGMGLCPSVARAIPGAIRLVREIVERGMAAAAERGLVEEVRS
jgi:hydrogenase maturation protease